MIGADQFADTDLGEPLIKFDSYAGQSHQQQHEGKRGVTKH
jgi:hypothetical protein